MRPSEALDAKREEVRAIIARYPVANPRVFGSVARGEDVEGSDLDILVDTLRGTTYFDLGELKFDLQDLLSVSVDIATPGALTDDISGSVHTDAVSL